MDKGLKDYSGNLEFGCSFPFNRNAFSRRPLTAQVCVSTGVANSASIIATAVVGDGISLLMAQSARLQQLLMLLFTWYMEVAADYKICTAHVTSRESAIKSTKALCAWDSGSATAKVTVLLMQAQDGTRCPGCSWKKYLPHKLKKSRFKFFINLRCFLKRFLALNVIIVK